MSLRPGDKAWIALGCGVLAYEIAAGPDELLSEAADRYMLRHPWLVRGVAFMLTAHVCNLVKPTYDPLHYLFRVKRYITR